MELIGNSKDREAIALLQEAVRTLSAQLSSVQAEVIDLAERHAESVRQASASAVELAALREEVSSFKVLTEISYAAADERQLLVETAIQELLADRRGMALMIAANTEQFGLQNVAIGEVEKRNDERIKQWRGMLARLELQTEADLAELRETNVALASTLLRLRTNSVPTEAD